MPPYKNKFQLLADQEDDNEEQDIQNDIVIIPDPIIYQKLLNIPVWAIQQVLDEQENFKEQVMNLRIQQETEDVFTFMKNDQGYLIVISSSEQIVNFVTELAENHYQYIIAWSGTQALILQNATSITQLWQNRSRFCYSIKCNEDQQNSVFWVLDSSSERTHLIKSVISVNKTLNSNSWQQIVTSQFDEMSKYFNINLKDYNYFMNAWFGSINIMSQIKIQNKDQLINAVNGNKAYISFKMCEDDNLTDFMLKNSKKQYGWRDTPQSKGEPLHQVIVHKYDDSLEMWGRSFALTFFIPSSEGLFDTKVVIRLTPKILDDQTQLLEDLKQNGPENWEYISVRKQPINEHVYAHKMNFENHNNKETFVFWSTKEYPMMPDSQEQCVGDQIWQFMDTVNNQNLKYQQRRTK
ncbi:Hypothetical_protein [Hexamita inflata]|uniref:Hypothetical_protein n=1 Tax=Hexamita inflata TaxID=28002 RepID=A0AA86NWL6_9EUKA|nr:Hypothetical protein HINF_LOCUS14616 [Hexamita inflata]